MGAPDAVVWQANLWEVADLPDRGRTPATASFVATYRENVEHRLGEIRHLSRLSASCVVLRTALHTTWGGLPMATLNEVIRQVGREQRAPVFDFDAMVRRAVNASWDARNSSSYMRDHNHPSAGASAAAGVALAQMLLPCRRNS